MALSNDLISQFVKTTKDDTKRSSEQTVYGTVVEYNGDKYVKLDGSELLTPISSTTNMINGERVTVMIKNHSATVTGNLSSPAARTEEVETIGEQVAEFDEVIAKKLSVEDADIKYLTVETANADYLKAKDADIKYLTATDADIKYLTVEKAEADYLKAETADIKYLTADDAKIKYLTVETANADYLKAKDAEIKYLTVEKAEADYLAAKDADIKYANIDFSNIGKAAMEYFYANSGLIKNVTVGDQTITGTLAGVTILGDLIEGNTIVAEKLVIKGEDGLYYKLNTDGITTEAEQTDYNSLNGSVIRAKSITATQISVSDLVAFGATIGGFNITDASLYSGVKESVDNTTRGIYFDKTGQVAIGDANNYIKFYKDTDGSYKLDVSADTVRFSSSGKTVEQAVNAAIVSTVEQFYLSTSPSGLSGGSWSTDQPIWEEGKYIWRRTLVTYGDGTGEYTPSAQGVCITGNTGAKGEDSVLLMIESSNGNIFKNSAVATTLTVNIVVGNKNITSYTQLVNHFGSGATLQWSYKALGDSAFTNITSSDSRISDNGFIFTLNPSDVAVKTVFSCSLNY